MRIDFIQPDTTAMQIRAVPLSVPTFRHPHDNLRQRQEKVYTNRLIQDVKAELSFQRAATPRSALRMRNSFRVNVSEVIFKEPTLGSYAQLRFQRNREKGQLHNEFQILATRQYIRSDFQDNIEKAAAVRDAVRTCVSTTRQPSQFRKYRQQLKVEEQEYQKGLFQLGLGLSEFDMNQD